MAFGEQPYYSIDLSRPFFTADALPEKMLPALNMLSFLTFCSIFLFQSAAAGHMFVTLLFPANGNFRETIVKERICFILVRTQFASNLGAAARVMKNMGFARLVLVQPQCEVGAEARMLAMKGAEVLDRASFFRSLEEAAQHLDLILGTTGRLSPRAHPLNSRMLAEKIVERFPQSSIGIAFGPEGNGLERAELRVCDWLLEIPTVHGSTSLNLAQAVAVIAYELHGSSLKQPDRSFLNHAGQEEIRALLSHVARVLPAIELPSHVSAERLLKRLARIAGRSQLEVEDVNLLRWLLSETKDKLDTQE